MFFKFFQIFPFSVLFVALELASAGEPDYRLPTNVIPLEYILTVQTYIPSLNGPTYEAKKNFTFDGTVTINLSCLENTSSITMQMHNILISEYALADSRGKTINLSNFTHDNVTQKVVFHLTDANLIAGQTYLFNIKYIGFLNDGLAGFYRSSFIENGVIRWLAVTDLEPTDARQVLPCFDEPSFKAIFNITIIYPSDLFAISNGIENSYVELSGGWAMTDFVPTPKMSTYLLAMCVSPFQELTTTSHYGTLVRVWARPSLVNDGWFALQVAPKLLTYYSDFFSIPFPLRKLDLVAVPDLSSAMENWGMITFQETDILVHNNTYDAANVQNTAVALAHEIAHQWFGDLVTLAWWDDLWLNEGFAEFMQYQGADNVTNNEFQLVYQFVPLEVDQSMMLDQVLTSRPIYDPNLVTPDQINGAFDAIAYDKGASIINQLQFTVGADIFLKGLRYYLTSYEYGNANHQDLWNGVQQAVDEEGYPMGWDGNLLNVTQFMNGWIVQNGFPVINVTRNYQGSATLNQSRFLLPENVSAVDNGTTSSNHTWYIPVCYSQTVTSICNPVWVQTNEITTLNGLSSSWLLLNTGVYGLFRTNYDAANWQLLLNQLQSNFSVIDVRNRAQLIDDSFNLARAGLMSYDLTLNLSTYLANEISYVPWQSASYSLTYLQNMFATTEYDQFLGKYLYSIMKNAYDKLGWTNVDSNDLINREFREYIITSMCKIEHKDCIKQALIYYKDNLTSVCPASIPGTSSCSRVSPNLRKAVYCTGISKGDADQFNYLYTKYPQEQIAVEKDNILYGLCCTTSVWALEKFSSGVFSLSTIIESVCQSFNTQTQVDQMQQFLKTYEKQLGSGLAAFVEGLKNAESNVIWMNTYANEVVQWFIKQFGQ